MTERPGAKATVAIWREMLGRSFRLAPWISTALLLLMVLDSLSFVAVGLALREIPGRDRTTPAGRFIGGYGPSIDAGRVLWVDYESAVSMHPTATGVPAERREERLASPSPDDNRVTHGCINVSPVFYETVVQPTFEGGGLFYILPDTDPLENVFPEFAQSRPAAQAAD